MHPFNFTEKLCRAIAFNLIPKKVRYWVVIKTWAEATTGIYSKTNCSTLTYDEAIRRSFESDAESRMSKAFCPCGHEILQDPLSKVYEHSKHTNIICSQCDLQTSWDLDAPVPLFITSYPRPLPEPEGDNVN